MMDASSPIPAIPVPLPPNDDQFVVKTEPKPSEKEEIKPEVSVDAVSEGVSQVSTNTALLCDLEPVDRLHITRSLKFSGMIFLRGKKNQFSVKNTDLEPVYTIREENSWWVGYLCYGLRPLQLRVFNGSGAEVMRISRPFAFTTRILPCALQSVQVYSPPGQLIGKVEQQWTPIIPQYLVTNKDGEEVFWIKGPRVTISCFNKVEFWVQRPDGTVVGSTKKEWEGVTHALFFAPFTERFGVAFERDLTQVEKALLLATSLLLDYMYYDV